LKQHRAGGGRAGGGRAHPKVEAVESGVEVEPEPEAVDLQEHLRQEQPQEHKLCVVWWARRGQGSHRKFDYSQPLYRHSRVNMMMLGGCKLLC